MMFMQCSVRGLFKDAQARNVAKSLCVTYNVVKNTKENATYSSFLFLVLTTNLKTKIFVDNYFSLDDSRSGDQRSQFLDNRCNVPMPMGIEHCTFLCIFYNVVYYI